MLYYGYSLCNSAKNIEIVSYMENEGKSVAKRKAS